MSDDEMIVTSMDGAEAHSQKALTAAEYFGDPELVSLTKEIVDRVMAVDMRVAMEGISDINREIILAELQAIRKLTRYGMLLATATTQPN